MESQLKDDGGVDFDSAIGYTGFGLFQIEILISCAFCLLSAGFQNGLPAYILPAAQCELNLDSYQIGLINAAFLIGGTCSAFFWGILADISGRKKLLVYSLLLDAVATFCCTLSNGFYGLALCRFVNGFLIGAPGSITFTYIAEFQKPENRTKTICYSGIFYTMSWLLLPVIALIVLTSQWEWKITSDFTYTSWRIFLAILILPELIAGISLIFLPESPKFLAGKDPNKALDVLQQIFVTNTRKSKEEFPIKVLLLDGKLLNFPDMGHGKISQIIGTIIIQIQELFTPPTLFTNILISAVMFCNMFGYFGLGLWLPEIFTRFEEFHHEHPNLTISLPEIINMQKNPTNDTCIPSFESSVFQSTLSMGLSSLAGNILSGWLAGFVKCYQIPLYTLLIGGVTSGLIYWSKSALQNLILACLFQSSMTIANMAIGCLVIELIPTSVNGIAICTVMCAGRIGAIISNIIFGLFMDKYCEIPIFIVTLVLFIGALLCYMLKHRSKERPIVDKKNNQIRNKISLEVSVISVTTL